MSPANVDRLHSELVKIIAEPQLSARLSELGNVPRVLSPAETAAVIKTDTEMWAKAARDAGLKRQQDDAVRFSSRLRSIYVEERD